MNILALAQEREAVRLIVRSKSVRRKENRGFIRLLIFRKKKNNNCISTLLCKKK